MSEDLSLYLVPETLPLVALECESAFNALTKQEKLYSHYLSAGIKIKKLPIFIFI